MTMPKGTKFDSGYATVTNIGMSYREIAEYMTENGRKMNHATARNYFLRAINKIARPIIECIGNETSITEDDLINNPHFQSALVDIINSIERE